MRDVRETALAFDRACREAGIQYAFMGAMAVIAWGQPRTTADVHALVRLERVGVERFVASLANADLEASAEDFLDALHDRAHVSIFDPASDFYVDVKIARNPDEHAEVLNAVDVPYRDGHLRVVRPEETIAFKLKFASEQDLADARSILVRQAGNLDETRLSALVQRLGVAGALARLREQLARAQSEGRS